MSIKHAVFTEDEAKNSWCPFARGDSVARERVAGDGKYHNRCIGSACMAWRWHATHINNPDDPTGDLIPSGDTYGYCGLAGAP